MPNSSDSVIKYDFNDDPSPCFLGNSSFVSVKGSSSLGGAYTVPRTSTGGYLTNIPTETKLEAVRVLINSLNNKNFATDAKLDEMIANLGDISDAAETNPASDASNIQLLKGLLTLTGEKQEAPTAYTLLARLKELQDKLGDVTENPTATYSLLYRIAELESKLDTLLTTVSGGNVSVQQSGSIVQLWGNDISERPNYTTISEPTAFTVLNANLDTFITDGTNDWVEVS